MREESLISPELLIDEEESLNIRPKKFSEYIGQENVKNNLKVYTHAAKMRLEALDHVLLYGPPGLGKTTLAHIISNELNVNMKITSGPAIERPGDLAAILTNLETNDVLFIDEIHRMNHSVEEVLYPAMEDYSIDIMMGKGPSAHSLRLDLVPFTLIAATTRAGMLTSPLRDRFGIIERLEFYTPDELKKIILRNAQIFEISITEKAAEELASRSRGTPRIANRLLKRVRDFAQVDGNNILDIDFTRDILEILEIDHLGLDKTDRLILETIILKYNGGPVGLDSLAATINEDSCTLEDLSEPFLLQSGLIQRTSRGRVATISAYNHLSIEPPKTF